MCCVRSDPHLASELVKEEVLGIQSLNMLGCIKHFVDNSQEFERHSISEQVGRRVQWELYYPAFQAAIDVGVGSAMCSYNKINGTWACENPQTLSDLKNKMGFDGWVMSDWGATHSTLASVQAGLDQEMPSDDYFGQALADAVKAGTVPESRIDDMVRRMVLPMIVYGVLDKPSNGSLTTPASTAQHQKLARTLSAAGTVLAKNSGPAPLLPLNADKLRSIAVIGDETTIAGGGSGHVNAEYIVTPQQGIQARVGKGVTVTYTSAADPQAAAAAAAAADVAVVVVAAWSTEGADRANLELPSQQDDLVTAVLGRQSKTVVVVRTPGVVLMPWADSAASIVVQWMAGQEAGHSLADILFGDVNPAGRMPLSFPKQASDIWLKGASQYPGVVNGQGQRVSTYEEGLLMGYRWFDAKDIEPLFPFGHGLSYANFSYSDLRIDGAVSPTANATVSFQVKNVGAVPGQEVAQLYLGFPASAGEPPQLLRGFVRTALIQPGGTASVSLTLQASDASIWDLVTDDWAVVGGTFGVRVGGSSRDIRLQGSVRVSTA